MIKIKIYHFLLIIIIFYSCSENKKTDSIKKEMNNGNQVIKIEFQSIIDSAKVDGAILVYDFQTDIYYSNNFIWANKQQLPASTFKIPNSIIALESGIIENDSTLFKWNGEKRFLKIWEQDLIFRDAFRFSCVPCYQELARKIGEKKMNKYLARIDYGDMKVDSINIDVFWLEGSSRISQFQQIDFLKRFYGSKLPISERTKKIMKRMMKIEEIDQYKLSGKTGLSITNEIYNGWFVGYIELESKVYFFATNIEPKNQFNLDAFIKKRKQVTFEALKQLNILKQTQ